MEEYRSLPEDVLTALLYRADLEEVEFFSSLVGIEELARLASAFANTNGGWIVLGATPGGYIKGVNPNKAIRLYEKAKRRVTPLSPFELSLNHIQGKTVAVIRVEDITWPLMVPGAPIYERVGTSIQPITARTIVANIDSALPNLDSDAKAQIAGLAMTIESMNAQIIKANRWQNKLIDMVIGGVIGAIISMLLARLIF